MQYQFNFKHMESSAALQSYAEEKIDATVRKFVTKPIEVNVTFWVDKHQHHTQCTLLGGDGFKISVEYVCMDMYGSVDHLIDRLAAQLKRKKDKLKRHKYRDSLKTLAVAPVDVEDDYTVDATDIIKYEQARRKRAS